MSGLEPNSMNIILENDEGHCRAKYIGPDKDSLCTRIVCAPKIAFFSLLINLNMCFG